jgi:hypothetical protein
MDLTTAARFKVFAEMTVADHDAWLTQVIPAVSQACARYMNRLGADDAQDFLDDDASHVESFDPDGFTSVFKLRGVPIVSVTSVVHGTTTLTSSTYKVLKPEGLVELDHYPLPLSDGRLVITYLGGLAADVGALATAYPDLEMACQMQLQALLREKDHLGSTSVSVAGSAVSFTDPGVLLPAVREILDRYRV